MCELCSLSQDDDELSRRRIGQMERRLYEEGEADRALVGCSELAESDKPRAELEILAPLCAPSLPRPGIGTPAATEKTMRLKKVETALGMMRTYLVEYVAQDDWGDHRADELAQTIRVCLRQPGEEPPKATQSRTSRLSREAFRRAIRFVNDNLDTRLRWEEIAAEVDLDPFTFGRGFKQATGMTPHQYVIRCRLRRAMKLLTRDALSLADVALEVGCSCQSHLTTLFRKHLGTTPGAFRVSAREERQRGEHLRGRETLGSVRRPHPALALAGEGQEEMRVVGLI
jgi:AraC-like DNA-binding protein